MNRGDRQGEDFLVIGRVLKPHGIKGDLRVKYFNPEDPLLSRYRKLFLKDRRRGILRPFKVLGARHHKKDFFILSLEGIRTREDAERWRDSEVLVHREDLPPLGEDEYYWEDLLGMEVFTRDGELLGRLTSILTAGGSDVYVVEGDRGEVMLPAIKRVILEVDVERRRMVVELPEGLLEE